MPKDTSSAPATSKLPLVADPSSSLSSSSSNYTDMREDQLGYWDLYQGMEKVADPAGKGWIDENGKKNPMLVAQLLLIANMAADRAEMHSTIGIQRDNWNKLFQSTLTGITMTATILAAMDGHSRSVSFSVPAFLMDAVVGGAMIGINQFQPSQLAEEQRTAKRLCKKLCDDIHYTLRISPELRQEAQSYLEETICKLMAVDKAYPLPLTPVVVEKFPEQIVAPVLSKHPDRAAPEVHVSGPAINGWEPEMSEILTSLCVLMQESDCEAYFKLGRRVENINKCCAVAAPALALLGATLNAMDAMDNGANLGVFAAVSSTLAAITNSFAHDAQLGMIFELYRNSIGYFAEMEASIHRAIRLPVEKRENGVLFNQRVAYELGRRPDELPQVLAAQKTAATLF